MKNFGALSLLFAAAASRGAPFLTADVTASDADLCVYSNTQLGISSKESAVVVDTGRGNAALGYRICREDTAPWPSGTNSVSFASKRSSDGVVSTAIASVFTKPSPGVVGGITLVAGAPASATPPAPPPPASPPAPASLWPTAVPLADGGKDSAVTLGVRFSSSVAGQILGVRFYKYAGNTGTHVANLWSASSSKLGTVTFAGETAAGWQQQMFAAPIAIAAGTTYVASYQATVGHYAFNTAYFAAVFTNAPLSASAGLYGYGAVPVFPTSSYQNGNYWVDVIFKAN